MARDYLGIIILIMDTHSLWRGTYVLLDLVFEANFGQFLVKTLRNILDFMVNWGPYSYIRVHAFIVLLFFELGSRHRSIIFHWRLIVLLCFLGGLVVVPTN